MRGIMSSGIKNKLGRKIISWRVDVRNVGYPGRGITTQQVGDILQGKYNLYGRFENYMKTREYILQTKLNNEIKRGNTLKPMLDIILANELRKIWLDFIYGDKTGIVLKKKGLPMVDTGLLSMNTLFTVDVDSVYLNNLPSKANLGNVYTNRKSKLARP